MFLGVESMLQLCLSVFDNSLAISLAILGEQVMFESRW